MGSSHTKWRSETKIFVTLAALALSALLAWAQLPPVGQVPDAPPQPGQLGPAPQKLPPDAVPNNPPPGTSNDQQDIPSDAPTFVARARLVFVPTVVTDKKSGDYIDGLTTKDFDLYDNGKPQKIVSDLIEQPLSVVLAVQANSDIEPMLPKIQRSGVLLQGLVTGQNGDLAVLAFDHRMQHIQDFTSDPATIDDAMQKIRAGSSTAAMIDAVNEADHMLRLHDPNNLRHRVILLLSRNVDKGSEMHLEETVRNMQFHNITVYCVDISKYLTALLKEPDYPRPFNGGIPPAAQGNIAGGQPRSETSNVQQADGNALSALPPLYRSIRDLFKKTPAEAFTTFTGGRIYNFATERGLENAITDIGKNLNSSYVLTYTPNDASDPGFHTIKVVVDRPGLLVDTRPGYWAVGGKQTP